MAELVQAPLQLYDQIKDSLGEQSTFKMNLSLGAHFTID